VAEVGLIKAMLDGAMTVVPRQRFGVADVRDVADDQLVAAGPDSARPARPAGRAGTDRVIAQKLCYRETVKNITVSVPDDVYRNARVAAAQRDTSVSALVVAFLEQLSGRMDEFTRLEALQREVQAGIGQFRAADRLSRDETHDRAVR
jgi:hypothetical protein